MKNNLFDLTGKVALVTGGAGLLATEHALALSEYGAKVILADINLERAEEITAFLKKEDCEIDFIKCDVTSRQSWEEVLNFILEKYKNRYFDK